jgi:hypothetical protein
MRHATALLYHVCAVASRNIRFANCGTSGKLTLWTRYVSGLMRFRDGSDSDCTSHFVQIWENVQRRSWQRLDERLGEKAWAVQEWHDRFRVGRKRRIRWGAKSRVCSSFSLISRALIKPTLLFSVVPIRNKTERPPFWHSWSDLGRIAGGAEHSQRKLLTGCIQTIAEALETVHTRGRELLRGSW